MPELLQVLPAAIAWQRLREHLDQPLKTETIRTADALDRVLVSSLDVPQDLPTFARSSMDGFAVRAADTWGASASLPAWLSLVGEVGMGQPALFQVGTGQAALVHTGGMIPNGADAVVMVEHTRKVENGSLEIYRPVAAGENVIQVGEDIRKGEKLFSQGHVLRPQDIGGLIALGVTTVEISKRPVVAILSQGDELVLPDSALGPGQVRDINSYSLSALTRKAGGEPLTKWGILPDRFETLLAAGREAMKAADVIVFSAGSSVGTRDLTAKVIGELGKPGILTHGLSVKPGKPTVMAVCDHKPVFGLPGNPVSAMIVFQLEVAPTIALLQGRKDPPSRPIRARLARNIASQTGREDYIPIYLEERNGDLWAVPIFGKSNLIYALVRADGLVQVPLDTNGLTEGEVVEVFPF